MVFFVNPFPGVPALFSFFVKKEKPALKRKKLKPEPKEKNL